MRLSAAVLFALVPACHAGTLVFDAISGGATLNVGGTPRTYMGQDFTAANPGGPLLIERVVVLLGSLTTQTYTNIRASVQLWDAFDFDLVYANPAGGVQQFDLGPLSLTAFNAYEIDLTFPAPIPLTGLTNHGIAFNFKGDTGGGLFDTDDLTTVVRYGAPLALGSNPSLNGYWRNASGRTDFNFHFSDLRFFLEGDSALAVQIYAVGIPEPATFGLAAACLLLIVCKLPRS
jgi:hypothetical protein